MSSVEKTEAIAVKSSSSSSEEELRGRFESWIKEHGKSYKSEEEKEKRFEIFKQCVRRIEAHDADKWGYTLGLNHFSDLTNDEFQSTYTGGYGRYKSLYPD